MDEAGVVVLAVDAEFELVLADAVVVGGSHLAIKFPEPPTFRVVLMLVGETTDSPPSVDHWLNM